MGRARRCVGCNWLALYRAIDEALDTKGANVHDLRFQAEVLVACH